MRWRSVPADELSSGLLFFSRDVAICMLPIALLAAFPGSDMIATFHHDWAAGAAARSQNLAFYGSAVRHGSIPWLSWRYVRPRCLPSGRITTGSRGGIVLNVIVIAACSDSIFFALDDRSSKRAEIERAIIRGMTAGSRETPRSEVGHLITRMY